MVISPSKLSSGQFLLPEIEHVNYSVKEERPCITIIVIIFLFSDTRILKVALSWAINRTAPGKHAGGFHALG